MPGLNGFNPNSLSVIFCDVERGMSNSEESFRVDFLGELEQDASTMFT
jgi:hypothetical protein